MRKAGLWLVPLVLVALAGACSEEAAVDPPASDVVLRVMEGEEVAADWTLAALEEAVPFIDAAIEGDSQKGPRLLDVLAASGIEKWQTAEVIGMGEGRTFEVGLEISSAEVDDGWVLDVTNRGTLKLAADNLPRQQWVRDVGEIRIP